MRGSFYGIYKLETDVKERYKNKTITIRGKEIKITPFVKKPRRHGPTYDARADRSHTETERRPGTLVTIYDAY